MNKVILQTLASVLIFFVLWMGLSQINWVGLFKVKQVSDTTETKLGELYWDLIKATEQEINDDSIIVSVDSLLTHICESNNIDRESIKLHLLQKDEINAFALPDNHLVLFSGLIINCENEDELMGVMSHELAHIEKNHVMRKLTKELGLSVLLSMTTGNGSGEIVKESVKMLSSTAYDRNLEREADNTAVDYLIKADINPEPFANFLYRLSHTESIPKQLIWISTHPHSEERSTSIIKKAKNKKIVSKEVVNKETWENVQDNLKALTIGEEEE